MNDEHSERSAYLHQKSCPAPPKRKKDPPLLILLIGVVFLALGGGGAYRVGIDAWHGLASSGWFKATGVVLRTELEKWSSTRSGYSYNMKVTYRYSVAGKEYQNDRMRYPDAKRGGDEAFLLREMKTKYPVNGSCTVFYDPQNPAESCLERGVNYFYPVVLGFVFFFMLLGGTVCFVGGLRDVLKPPPGDVAPVAVAAPTDA